MEISIYKSDNHYCLDYGAKRKVYYWFPGPDELTEKQRELFEEAWLYSEGMVSIETLKTISDLSICRLVERLARSFCGMYAPTRSSGLLKSAVRGAILSSLNLVVAENKFKPNAALLTLVKFEEAS